MRKNSITTIDLIAILLGETDNGSGRPHVLPGHVEDRLASMGGGTARSRPRFPRRRAS
jgi:hypothetical protein